MPFQFEHPELLCAMPVIGAFATWLFLRRVAYPKRRRHTGLLAGALTLAVLGLARPQWGQAVTASARSGSNVVLAMDVSQSMLAQDIAPSRMRYAITFAELLSRQLPQSKMAIFPFAADGYLQLPLTSDHTVVSRILPTLNPNLTTNQGSGLNTALATLFQRIQQMERAALKKQATWLPTQVVLISDGESHEPVDREILQNFKAKQIPIYTVGVGTQAGGRIPLQYGRQLRSRTGKFIQTKLNVDTLSQVAQRTGGQFFSGSLEALSPLTTEIRKKQRSSGVKTKLKVTQEYYPYLFLMAVVLFLIEMALTRWEFAWRRYAGWLVLLSFNVVENVSYANGEEAALLNALETAQDHERRAPLAYNLGVFYRSQKQFKKAAEYFQESGFLSEDATLKKKSLFNLGNMLTRSGELMEAAEAYQQAIDVTTEDTSFDAETNQRLSDNLVLLQQAIEKAQQQQQGDSQEDRPQQGQAQDRKGPKKDFEREFMSEAKKKRIFDLIASEEQQTRQRLQRSKKDGATTAPNAKPW